MNKQTARRLAMTAWLGLTRHFPDNMVGLTQYKSCYDLRFYAKNGQPDKEEVFDHIAFLNRDNVYLRTHIYNENQDWQLHIVIVFEVEQKTN